MDVVMIICQNRPLPSIILAAVPVMFALGYSTARFFDQDRLDQAKMFAYIITMMWVFLVVMGTLSSEVEVARLVHVLAALPLSYIFGVDFKNIWKSSKQ